MQITVVWQVKYIVPAQTEVEKLKSRKISLLRFLCLSIWLLDLKSLGHIALSFV